jgi:predicted O-linked N-acetylglucosamine transferase (SPINDLY family)
LLLGECLLACGEARQAAEAFDAATYAEPESGEAWLRLSAALSAADDLARARECAARAASLGVVPATTVHEERGEPKRFAAEPSVSMLSDLAYILLNNGLHDEAIETLATALALDPSNLGVRWTLAIARLKPVYRDTSDMQVARASFKQAMDETATWYQRTPGIADAFKTVGVNQPFFLSYQPFNNRDLLLRHGSLCCAWMATMPTASADGVPLTHARPPANPVGRRLRLGIASTQIRDHSTWNAITKGWVTNIDPKRFEVVIFQLNGDGDQETELARRSAAHVESRPASLPEWVQAIRHASLDVLLYPSVGMDPLTLQLGSLRLAPVQAAAWGHPETTGLPTIDLYFSAEAFEPADAAEHYCETLVRLPHLGVYVEPLKPKMVEIDLHSLGFPDEVPLLLCPGAPFKYSPLDDDVWVEIASQLTRGVFRKRLAGRLVFFRGRAPAIDRMLEIRLRAAFARGGVDFDAHVTYLEHLDRPRFFGLLRRSALMLDTLGFSGFNLAVQAMECSVPLLAYEGEFLRGRLASAVLRRLDLPELVATTKQEFIRKAVELALDEAKRTRLRAAINERREVLFHDLEPVRALETELTAAVLRSRR